MSRPRHLGSRLVGRTSGSRATDAEVIVIGCTIVSSANEIAVRADETLESLPILNTNLLAIRQAQTMAALAAQGQFRVARGGYYA